ncbi:PTS transporter subunit EIIC [Vibrio lentus]|nr:PTS transporter subunit EIIC [Vibrio lentus]
MIKSILNWPGWYLVGGVAAWASNRFFRIQLPEYLGFFAGKRAVPIITGFSAIGLAILLSASMATSWRRYLLRSLIGLLTRTHKSGVWYLFIVERSLIPFGLHHVWNVPFFFEAGTCVRKTLLAKLKTVFLLT